MKNTYLAAVLALVVGTQTYAQRFVKIDQDDRRFWINVGAGPRLAQGRFSL